MTTKSLNRLLSFATQEKAEKLVISGQKQELACRCYLPLGEEANFHLPKSLEEDLSSSLRRLLKLAPDELTSGRYFKIRNRDYRLDFHLSILPSKNGEKIIIDIIHKQNRNLSLGQLGLQREERQKFKQALSLPRGLIIISSPERQGRTTTLAACLREIDTDKRSVYFLGNSPEINIDGVSCPGESQEVWDRVLRHDSDIIAVDNDNDLVLANAILAAATGRLVLATVKAGHPKEALDKLLNLGLPSNLITANLKLISGQRLVELKRPIKKTHSILKSRKEAGQTSRRQEIGVFTTITYEKDLRHPSL